MQLLKKYHVASLWPCRFIESRYNIKLEINYFFNVYGEIDIHKQALTRLRSSLPRNVAKRAEPAPGG